MPYIYESVIASNYGWDLDKIRALDLIDFHVHLRICLVKENVDREFQASLVGAGPQSEKAPQASKIPNKSEFKGPRTETKREKVMSFTSKVREVRI